MIFRSRDRKFKYLRLREGMEANNKSTILQKKCEQQKKLNFGIESHIEQTKQGL